MSDTSEIQVQIEQALASIRADTADRESVALAAREAEDARVARVTAIKAKINEANGPIVEAIQNATDPREKEALRELERRTLAQFEEELLAATTAFNGKAPNPADSATPGEVTNLEANIHVLGDNSGDAEQA